MEDSVKESQDIKNSIFVQILPAKLRGSAQVQDKE